MCWFNITVCVRVCAKLDLFRVLWNCWSEYHLPQTDLPRDISELSQSEISLWRSVSNFRLNNPKLSEIRRYILLHTLTQTDSVFNCSITRIKTTDKKSRYINIHIIIPLHHSYRCRFVNLLLDHFRTGNIYEYDRSVSDSRRFQ